MNESGPQIAVEKAEGIYNLYDFFVINPATVSCVLSPVLYDDAKVSVVDADGNPMMSEEGVTLNNVSVHDYYLLSLEKIGQLKVNYDIKVDGSIRTGSGKIEGKDLYYMINVYDNVKPVIKFSDSNDVSLKIHSSHTLKTFTVSDNFTSTENLKIYTIVTDDHFNVIDGGFNHATVAFHKTGTFYVIVYATDEYGNAAKESYKVIVTE